MLFALATYFGYGLGLCLVALVIHVLSQPDPYSFSLDTYFRFRNWSREVSLRPNSVVYPESVADVVAVVKETLAAGSSLRVVGAGHSWNDAMASSTTMVSLDRMDAILNIVWLDNGDAFASDDDGVLSADDSLFDSDDDSLGVFVPDGVGDDLPVPEWSEASHELDALLLAASDLPPCSIHSADAVAHVTVEAGIRFQALQDALAEQGLAFAALPSVAAQSAGGLIATGTHSNGPGHQNLSNYVAAVEIVDGAGNVRVVTNGPSCDDARWFDAVRLSLGSLGIITKITFELVPLFKLTKIEHPVSWDYVLDHVDELIESEEFFKLWTFPRTGVTQLSVYRRTDPSVPSTTGLASYLENVVIQQYVVNAVLWATSWFPSVIGPTMRCLTAILGERVAVDRSDALFNIPVLIRHFELEIAFSVESARQVLDDLLAELEASDLAFNMPLEIRFVAADQLWLSNNYSRAAIHITACLYGLDPKPYYDLFEAFAAQRGGRPHWGKYFTHDAAQLAALYPRWDEFQAARAAFDPHHVFANDWSSRVLGEPRA
ncbi:FAD-linked oxidoreductase [Thecamonas trahens ATCC 50062]|uniref:FAD-linked oxidoreductase n=1 Tax=Thecamonas trahens ATCC 50062 TaxID=461836 RepID=A0A0L0DAF7_THETB|nr:FAD-linked oxidoreductase [Thecamonas trahens ATCC 50062]KNC48283.1 FAD-linked oxidoreductase [Thecamonas trahens ATCC 50062]|eukprot:XP_013758850.1 FAD-linked oxidoreductase [Thecamonas trahens ATCC 50062]